MIARPPSRCGCSPHCALHESAGPVERIDCLPAAIVRARRCTYGIARLVREAGDPRVHPAHRARVAAELRDVLADLVVAAALVRSFALGELGKGGPS